jgi:alkanesulfonate monooxygenase SsuD/methylene tetrahydromethanopterin reductase-like flavin-dependent oxidoreductase (luciferase family)
VISFGPLLNTAQFPGWSPADILGSALLYADTAESLGYERIWVTEHHFIPVGVCSSAVTLAAFLLGRTTRIRVGTAVCPLPVYHPLHLAQAASLLDQVSGGRFDFGIGKGGFRPDLETFSIMGETLMSRMAEGVEILVNAWTQDRVSAAGQFTRFSPVSLNPPPRTLPHVPLYIAGSGPATVGLAARYGASMLIGCGSDDAAIAMQVARYRDLSRRFGHDPDAAAHACMLLTYVAESADEARECVLQNLAWFLVTASQYSNAAPAHSAEGATPEHRQEAHVAAHLGQIFDRQLVGTPARCIKRIREIVERTGIRHFILLCEGAANRERTIANLERFARDVASAFAVL